MTFIVEIGGRRYDGWTEAQVTRSLETVAGRFGITLSERWPGEREPRPIRPDDRVTIALDGETVLTGRVDAVSVSYDARSHAISVEGRDAAAELVDCSVPVTPVEWRGETLLSIASALAADFGIRVLTETFVGAPFEVFRTEEGETVWEAIGRGCAMRAVLAVSDGRGNVVLTRPQRRRAAVRLERGRNILSARASLDRRDRYGHYIVLAQQGGTDFLGNAETAHVLGEATDPGMRRQRRLVTIAEQGAGLAEAQERAEWEASVRAAQARRASVRVQGWREGESGRLWAPGTVASVFDDALGLAGDMLIAMARQSISGEGTVTDIDLLPPDAFQLRREEPEDEGIDWWS